MASWTINGVRPSDVPLDQPYPVQVSATWAGNEMAATNAPFRVYAGGQLILEVFADQTRASNGFEDAGAMWQGLGQVVLPADVNSITVELSDDANGYVQADAVHVVGLMTGEITVRELPDIGDATNLVDEQSVVDFGYTELFPTDAARVFKTFEVVNEGGGDLELYEPIDLPLGFTLVHSVPGRRWRSPADPGSERIGDVHGIGRRGGPGPVVRRTGDRQRRPGRRPVRIRLVGAGGRDLRRQRQHDRQLDLYPERWAPAGSVTFRRRVGTAATCVTTARVWATTGSTGRSPG